MTGFPSGVVSPDPFAQTPQHGDRGDAETPVVSRIPRSLSIAISRESGARGASIARRVGEKLGWQVYTQDLLEYSLHNDQMRQDILDGLSTTGSDWVEAQLDNLVSRSSNKPNQTFLDLMRMMLALGVQGEVILIGRGACHLLPQESTLCVRLVAPESNRIAYMRDWLRLTDEEAELQVQSRDAGRREFIETNFGCSPSDVHLYDLVINTGFVGEETSGELIIQAAKAKMNSMYED